MCVVDIPCQAAETMPFTLDAHPAMQHAACG